MNYSTLKSLTTTNDHKIRQEYFCATANLLKKLRRLEMAHKEFTVLDQRLYQDWYNLTFREELETKTKLEQRLKSLHTFKLHLWYVAETSHLTSKEAFRLLTEEERQYQNGDEDWKFIINKLRQHRLENAKKKQQQINNTLFEIPPNESASDLSRLDRKGRIFYFYLKDSSDLHLQKVFADPSKGLSVLKQAFEISIRCGDLKLIGKIYQLADGTQVAKALRSFPDSMIHFINQILKEQASETTTDLTKLKSLFRRLARLLHPDTLKTSELDTDLRNWLQQSYQEVQKAYANEDYDRLKKLEIIISVQKNDLTALTLDQIYQSSLVFAEEYEKLKSTLRSEEKHPAWRFSSRRNYSGLAAKTRERLQKEIALLQAEVLEVESWLSTLKT